MYAPVQTDKTAPSAEEILKEARAVIGDEPLTDKEIRKIKDNDIRRMPGQYETAQSVLNAVETIVKFDRPDDYVQTLKGRIEAQKDADVEAAAREVIHPDRLTWVIVGDLSRIEKPVRALKLGAVHVIDADGNPAK
jgi:predicted Zn-dependent peptidase